MNPIFKQPTKRMAPRYRALETVDNASLTRALDAFEAGHLRDAALAWEAMEKRDDMIRSVALKRKKSVARHGWEILMLPNLSPAQRQEAQRQKHALQYFYENMTCSNAIDENERGGFKLLVRQMMDAVGKRYAVHEIVWKPTVLDRAPWPRESACDDAHPCVGQRDWMAAEFRFVPLWFFENTEGSLRLLTSETAMKGQPLDPTRWMVAVGDGVMFASSIAWMIKRDPLNDWLDFCKVHGRPAIYGRTSAARGSSDWDAMVEAVQQLIDERASVTSNNDSVSVIDLKGSGESPFERLIARMDRVITVLWRGSDLSTLSRERGYGASLQDGETDILEQDDAEMISETLNRHVDAQVIAKLFGPNTPLLARIKVLVTPRQSTEYDLKIDQFLITHGARLSMSDALARYGRAPADADEEALAELPPSRVAIESQPNTTLP